METRVEPHRPTVVLVTGAAPYLGGSQTWRPLREAAPDMHFIEIDPLLSSGAPDVERELRTVITAALDGADALIAHAGAARPAIETVARVRADLPVLLLSPMLVRRMTVRLRFVRAAIDRPFLSRILVGYARSKHHRLCQDRRFVIRQLAFFVSGAALDDLLVDEAQARLEDPRAALAVDRTAEFFATMTTPLDLEADKAVRNRRVLLGTGAIDKKTAKWMPATILAGVTGAAMIEAPGAVVQALREMLA